jgi:molybdopterin synthase catalytic subunit
MSALLVDRPIDPSRLLAAVSAPENGAAILFVGTVRDLNDGRHVTGIDYSAYSAMAQRELDEIVRDAKVRFGTSHVAVEHRLGTLTVGEASVAVAVAHPRRAAAFDAARFIVEELKRRVPIWKREHYVDGTREWVDPTRASHGPPAAPSAEHSRQAAEAAP